MSVTIEINLTIFRSR